MEKKVDIGGDKICRVCANSGSYLHPINAPFENITFATIIQELFKVQIEESDNLPKFICFDCEGIVLRAYKLREICIENDRIFRSRLNASKTQECATIEISDDESEIIVNELDTIANIPKVSKKRSRSVSDESETNKSNDTESTLLSAQENESDTLSKDLFAEMADYLAREEVIEVEDDESEPENRAKLDKLLLYRCKEKDCSFANFNSDVMKVHTLLDHSNVLQRPSKNPQFDVEVNKKNSLIERPFGQVRSRKSDKRVVTVIPNRLFCKLCINSTGKIVTIEKNSEQFLLHIVYCHLGASTTEEASPSPVPSHPHYVRTKKKCFEQKPCEH